MPKSDIRQYTRLIIRRGNEYLVGVQVGTGLLRWSISPWDAWWTRTRANAASVAMKTDGHICLFNPVAGDIKRF